MKYMRGFLMAWGMFCWIPCPYEGWREEDRKAQIQMLPVVGLFMGVLFCFIWFVMLRVLPVGGFLAGALLCFVYFLLTGFIHLDGFMDCSDAIMPRHPSMEERRRILKDSTSGAFAVICVVFAILLFCASLTDLYGDGGGRAFAAVICIFTCSRAVSAASVLGCKTMSTSQYNKAEPNWKGGILPVVIAAVVVVAGVFMGDVCDGIIKVLVPAVATVLTAILVGAYDRAKLGGMNGDISGHMITLSETVGVLVMAVVI